MSQSSNNTEKSESFYNLSVGLIAFLMLFPIGGGLARDESEYAPYAMWFGVALMVYYIFLYVGSNPFAKLVSAQRGSKWFFFIISIFITLESARVTGVAINSIFGIDASALPTTHFIVSTLNTFLMSKYLFIIFTVWGGLTFIGYLIATHTNNNEKFSFPNFFFAISGLVVGGISLMFITNNEGDALNKKIYVIAHSFDFNSNVICESIKIKGSGIFLGPEQKRVFMDSSEQTLPNWYDALYYHPNKLTDITLPSEFQKVECK